MRRKNYCDHLLKDIDIYSRPIQLTYKGRETFKSSIGGFISLLVLFCLISISAYRVNDMLRGTLTVVSKNTIVTMSNSYVPPENISAKNITVAFMLSTFFADATYDEPYYGSFKLTQSIFTIKSN